MAHDKKMIGVFDSGSGGLTVLKAIRDVLPSADVLYMGDIKHAPYGSRSREELSKLTVNAIRVLQERGATRIVSACNSVSASLAVSVFDIFSLDAARLIEMVGPTVASFKGSDARLLLCATQATIASGIYQNAFRMIGKDVATLPIPELAAAIEFAKPRKEQERIVREAFANVQCADFDVLVLACTHYPLVADLFRAAAPTLHIFDPAHAVADRAEKLFWPQEVGSGTTRYLVTEDSAPFYELVERLFPGTQSHIEVVEYA